MRIVAEDVSFTYNKKTKFAARALDGVSLTVEEGDFFGIIGHTGSGKSTFIQLLNGLLPVGGGKLNVGDVDLSFGVRTDKKKLRQLRSKVGMVFQYPEYQLFEETVFKDVAFGYGNFFPEATGEQVREAVFSALDAVGLSREYAEKSPFDLSGGQKRRVAIAGVLVTRPEVLVLDEPVAGLDPVGKNDLMKLLHSVHGESCKTVVIVSHDMDDVADNCNKAAVFSEGKIAACGAPEEIFSDGEKMASLRLGVPVTASVASALGERGIGIESDLSTDGFVSAVAAAYSRSRKEGF